jgi:hypothetical protein
MSQRAAAWPRRFGAGSEVAGEGTSRLGRAAVEGREQIAVGGMGTAYPEPMHQCAGSATRPLGKASMEQSHTSRLARWMSPPLPALDLIGWPRLGAVALAQLWPVFGVLLLLCAMLWGIGEYAAYKVDLRRAETGRYLAQFREPPVAAAWQHLNAVWQAEEVRQNALLGRMAGLSGAALADALRNYRHFVLETVEERGLAGDIEIVHGFFSRLGVCIHVGNCDPAVARAQLGPAVWQFRNQHYDYFALEGVAAEIDRVVSLIAPEEPRPAPGPLALN